MSDEEKRVNYIMDVIDHGWKCLYCGERVPDTRTVVSDVAISFSGVCRSSICVVLPAKGNPFHVVIS